MDIFLLIILGLGFLSALIVFRKTKDVLITWLVILMFYLTPAMALATTYTNDNDNETDSQDSYCCCSSCCCGDTYSADTPATVSSESSKDNGTLGTVLEIAMVVIMTIGGILVVSIPIGLLIELYRER